MIRYINQNITTVIPSENSFGIIMHGVNCQRAMGSGVALALMTKWPKVRSDYMTIAKKDMIPGMIQVVTVEEHISVINCFTQKFYGRTKGVRYANPAAIEQCFKLVVAANEEYEKYAEEHKLLKSKVELYMPRIGCNLGGLTWNEVGPIVESVFVDRLVTVCDWS